MFRLCSGLDIIHWTLGSLESEGNYGNGEFVHNGRISGEIFL